MDLQNFIQAEKMENPIVAGFSMGCAVIWSYIELFGDANLSACVFVDQAPCQYKLPDWKFGSKGIYDDASCLKIRDALHASMEAFADGNEECCTSHPLDPQMSAILKAETLKCSPTHLANLMDDHARLDWRPILPRISKPCLNLYGTDSGCFPVEGTQTVSQLIPNCIDVAFDSYNHWLYIENPSGFVSEVASFLKSIA